eukprot:6179908-Pleurochrysis_carterae.AAC.6
MAQVTQNKMLVLLGAIPHIAAGKFVRAPKDSWPRRGVDGDSEGALPCWPRGAQSGAFKARSISNPTAQSLDAFAKTRKVNTKCERFDGPSESLLCAGVGSAR